MSKTEHGIKRLKHGGEVGEDAKTTTMSSSSLRDRILEKATERKRLEDMFSIDEKRKRDATRVVDSLPSVFDQVFLFMKTKRIRSLPLGELAHELASRSPNKTLDESAALKSLNYLVELLPEFCSIKEVQTSPSPALFVIASLTKDQKASEFRVKLLSRLAEKRKVEDVVKADSA